MPLLAMSRYPCRGRVSRSTPNALKLLQQDDNKYPRSQTPYPSATRKIIEAPAQPYLLRVQPQSQRQQAGISTHTQRRQDHNHLPTRPKLLLIHPIIPHLTEELPVPDPAPIGADKHYGHAINSKESADAVEFGCEDLEDDKGEGKLRDGCTDVGTLKGTLSGADLDEPGGRVRKESAGSDGMGELLLGGEDDGAGTVLYSATDSLSAIGPSGIKIYGKGLRSHHWPIVYIPDPPARSTASTFNVFVIILHRV
ncbi:hypothetical protein V494_08437 [Pseudogymnoascus sp. VKM F-4513 (FW-928)]|nr:hypothetical protein V494_08437 [Pseudogymnoascus sp. VKM F-4513 (FW-928)]